MKTDESYEECGEVVSGCASISSTLINEVESEYDSEAVNNVSCEYFRCATVAVLSSCKTSLEEEYFIPSDVETCPGLDVGVGETTASCLCGGSACYVDISATLSSAFDVFAAVRRLNEVFVNSLKDSSGLTVSSCTIDVTYLLNLWCMTDDSCCNCLVKDADTLRICSIARCVTTVLTSD